MNCHHVLGHRSLAHADLCVHLGHVRRFFDAYVPGLCGAALSIEAYQVEAAGDDAACRAMMRRLDAHVAKVKSRSAEGFW